ncbi:YhcN/YlaJ family sporulation lipoprotein [Metabacillus litoralis]|uniref:YhcN/YlaJ family sporulation lipoprotein n=2 Tax=Metabacillus TaxID=2675233 RepID=A0ABS7URX8_9BACI|nr:YhcN/YlaJ family sporulation lipoprotein [Metabacillus rhizolycopersici]MBZ5751050.1 YhcN/YlaJ family sporulation lipoprotein [Metabacillus rhizolycopersici]MCM3651837.1 YhcN/YlaJ family sporulation lipoprotein [Metabacillus litoralis]
MTNANNEKNSINITNVSSQNTKNLNMTDQVKQLLNKQKEVSDVKVVNSDKELFIAAEIKHMDRFRIKEIEKKLKKLTEDNYPNHNVTLSTDMKIFLELDELEKKVNEKNMSKKKIEKELKRIKSLSEEQT